MRSSPRSALEGLVVVRVADASGGPAGTGSALPVSSIRVGLPSRRRAGLPVAEVHGDVVPLGAVDDAASLGPAAAAEVHVRAGIRALSLGWGCESVSRCRSRVRPSRTVISAWASAATHSATVKRSPLKALGKVDLGVSVEGGGLADRPSPKGVVPFTVLPSMVAGGVGEIAVHLVVRDQAGCRAAARAAWRGAFSPRRRAAAGVSFPGSAFVLGDGCSSPSSARCCSAVGSCRMGSALPLRPSRPFSGMVLKKAKKR